MATRAIGKWKYAVTASPTLRGRRTFHRHSPTLEVAQPFVQISLWSAALSGKAAKGALLGKVTVARPFTAPLKSKLIGLPPKITSADVEIHCG